MGSSQEVQYSTDFLESILLYTLSRKKLVINIFWRRIRILNNILLLKHSTSNQNPDHAPHWILRHISGMNFPFPVANCASEEVGGTLSLSLKEHSLTTSHCLMHVILIRKTKVSEFPGVWMLLKACWARNMLNFFYLGKVHVLNHIPRVQLIHF